MKLGDKKPEKIPMYVYYIIVGVIIVVLNLLVVPAVQERSVQKTDYSTFIENVEEGNVSKATVDEDYIYYEIGSEESGGGRSLQDGQDGRSRSGEPASRRRRDYGRSAAGKPVYPGYIILQLCDPHRNLYPSGTLAQQEDDELHGRRPPA